MDREDIPAISPPSDSTKIEGLHAEVKKPLTETRRPAPPAGPQRASTETRRALTSPPPPRSAPPPAPAPARDEEDPEKLLREYADRQKNKIARLEQDLQKTSAERDSLRSRSEGLSRDLQEARTQLQMIPRQEEMIKDLQQKLDAALLSNGMAQAETSKLRMRANDLEANLKKTEERAAQAEKTLSETQSSLRQQTQARQEAEAKIAVAVQALQGKNAPGAAPAKK